MIDVCLTSCGRPDLLEITLKSFFEFNDYPLGNFFIYEDSGTPNYDLEKRYPNIQWINGSERKGQVVALDTLWSNVKTPYAFFQEDDWQFLKKGFIEKSIRIMDKMPDVLQVRGWLESYSAHPVEFKNGVRLLKTSPNLWSGTNFNPSVKRKKDYDLIGTYGKHTVFNFNKPWKSEAIISKIYHGLGYKAALMEGYLTHIGGDGRHVSA